MENDFYKSQARHYRQCRREAIVVGVIWVVALAWCTSTFITMGYVPADQRPEVPDMVWGIPAWVFWGLYVPWIVLIGVTWWFAIFVLKDDEPYAEPPKGKHDAAGD